MSANSTSTSKKKPTGIGGGFAQMPEVSTQPSEKSKGVAKEHTGPPACQFRRQLTPTERLLKGRERYGEATPAAPHPTPRHEPPYQVGKTPAWAVAVSAAPASADAPLAKTPAWAVTVSVSLPFSPSCMQVVAFSNADIRHFISIYETRDSSSSSDIRYYPRQPGESWTNN